MAVRDQAEILAALQAVGKHLRELRHREGLTQSQLAEASGLDLRNYQNIEQGKSNLRLGTLVRIATFYGVSLASIMQGVPHPNGHKKRAAEPTEAKGT